MKPTLDEWMAPIGLLPQELPFADVVQCPTLTGLTHEFVNRASGLDLHRFSWLDGQESRDLPRSWNAVVDLDAPA